MRSIVTLSLPAQKVTSIKLKAKKRGFTSVSEYFRYLIDFDADLIPSAEVRAMAQRAHADYSKGLLKKRRSLQEIL